MPPVNHPQSVFGVDLRDDPGATLDPYAALSVWEVSERHTIEGPYMYMQEMSKVRWIIGEVSGGVSDLYLRSVYQYAESQQNYALLLMRCNEILDRPVEKREGYGHG